MSPNCLWFCTFSLRRLSVATLRSKTAKQCQIHLYMYIFLTYLVFILVCDVTSLVSHLNPICSHTCNPGTVDIIIEYFLQNFSGPNFQSIKI